MDIPPLTVRQPGHGGGHNCCYSLTCRSSIGNA